MYGEKPFNDGFTYSAKGHVYVTDVQNNAIGVISRNGKYKVLYQDKMGSQGFPVLLWPDGLAAGADGYIYGTANQLLGSDFFLSLDPSLPPSQPPSFVYRFKSLTHTKVGR